MNSIYEQIKDGLPQAEEKIKEKIPQDQIVLNMILRFPLYYDENDNIYIKNDVGFINIKSTDFDNWVYHEYYNVFRHFYSNLKIKALKGYLSHEAKKSGQLIKVYNRFAFENGHVGIDIGDRQNTLIVISKDGCSINTQPNAVFKRFPHNLELPFPANGIDFKEVLQFLNLSNTYDQILVLCWIVASVFINIVRPILWFRGEGGSAKSSLGFFIRSLLDPANPIDLALPDSKADFAQQLDHNAIPFYDNVSQIPPKIADLLCKGATGGGFSKKELFTDQGDVSFYFKKPIIMTSVDLPGMKKDLYSRLLLIDLKIPAHYEEETDLQEKFKNLHPQLLGALCNTISKTLQIYPSIKIKPQTRCPDFERYAAAAAEALGYGKDAFVEAMRYNVHLKYGNKSTATNQINIPFQPNRVDLSMILAGFMEDKPEWIGTFEGLHELLQNYLAVNNFDQEILPPKGNVLSRRINELQDSGVLAQFGLEKLDLPSKKKKLVNKHFICSGINDNLQELHDTNDDDLKELVDGFQEILNRDPLTEEKNPQEADNQILLDESFTDGSYKNPSVGRFELP